MHSTGSRFALVEHETWSLEAGWPSHAFCRSIIAAAQSRSLGIYFASRVILPLEYVI